MSVLWTKIKEALVSGLFSKGDLAPYKFQAVHPFFSVLLTVAKNVAVARENGARGGTILNARGVAREKEAAFFGITIHAEKEILMLVVEKSIRDTILNALYKAMGMDKKAQGIAFSLPVSDVAGLVKPPEETQEEA